MSAMIGDGNPSEPAPYRLRKMSIAMRREAIGSRCGPEDFALTGESETLLELSDVLVESAVGYFAVPIGVAEGFFVDGKKFDVPLATEEPSVVAACAYAAGIISSAGGFTTSATAPVMTGTAYFEPDPRRDLAELLRKHASALLETLDRSLSRIEKRGGGRCSFDIAQVGRFVKISFDVDVRDAMGANLVNSASEAVGRRASDLIGAPLLMAILTNASERRTAKARFSIDPQMIPRNGFAGEEIARRIVLSSELADTDPDRAVTHNKGIMNGISALALATGNDTRGVEAGAHSWAARSGRIVPLTHYQFHDGALVGKIELPLPFASTGGAVSIHPAAQACLRLAGTASGTDLARLAAAVGLAQNFAALLALVTRGIQSGHMRLHARRLAFQAGARGPQVESVSGKMSASGNYTLEAAQQFLSLPG